MSGWGAVVVIVVAVVIVIVVVSMVLVCLVVCMSVGVASMRVAMVSMVKRHDTDKVDQQAKAADSQQLTKPLHLTTFY